MRNIPEIIAACGGHAHIAETIETPERSFTESAVRKWENNGIPNRHWDAIMTLSGATTDELHQANKLLFEEAA